MPAISTNRKRRANFKRTTLSLCANARNESIFFDEIDYFRLHHQMESRIAPGLFLDEIEEVPLRHQCHELAVSRKVGEIPNGNRFVFYLTRKLAYLLMRKFEEGVENMQLMHQLESGGMNRVSAKIT